MKILISGANGFTGEHLIRYISDRDETLELHGIIEKETKFSNLEEEFKKNLKVWEGDICNYEEISTIIREILPDRIFHLAAVTFGPKVKENPRLSMEVNFFGTLNLLNAVLEAKIEPRIHIPGSSAEYGLIKEEENPVTEDNIFRPMDFYGVTKIAQDMLSYQYFRTYKMKIIRTRTFNQTGPGERKDFVCSNFAYQIALIEKRKKEPVIKVGNLEAKRDFTDVRDVVKAYYLVMEKGEIGEVYNVCSNKGYAIREVLDILLNYSSCKIKVEVDETRFRPSDVPVQIGSYEKINQKMGWKPNITLEDSLKDLLNYWRNIV
jgi:GDP-4-dehydro-6-deoxy-D-mannose reductase